MWIRKLTKELPSALAMMICPCGKRLDACNVKEVLCPKDVEKGNKHSNKDMPVAAVITLFHYPSIKHCA